jgi:hypothetical protein
MGNERTLIRFKEQFTFTPKKQFAKKKPASFRLRAPSDSNYNPRLF